MYQSPMTAVLASARAAFAALLLLTAPGAGTAVAAEFLQGFGDVPAMPGLTPARGGSLVFDKPAGRIAEAEASGSPSRAQIESFYAGALPPLGWTAVSPDRYRREGEELSLEFPAGAAAGRTTVRFTLTPR